MSGALSPMNTADLLAVRIDELCDEFEAAVRAGTAPAIDDYLQRVSPDQRAALLAELVPVEMEYRRTRDEQPSVARDQVRLPGASLSATEPKMPRLRAIQPKSDDHSPLVNEMEVALTIATGPLRGQRFALGRTDTVLVGRGPSAQVRLPASDKSLSRVHFQVDISQDGCRLTHLSKTNGTLVNGQPVSVADLQHGDIILVGETAIRVEIQSTAAN